MTLRTPHRPIARAHGPLATRRDDPRPFDARPSALAGAALLALLACSAPDAAAQESTRIVAATVHADSASVERALNVPGGTRHITIACVPAAVDVATLQVDGDPALRLGDIRATPLPATRAEECVPSPTEARRSAIATQRAALEAQRDSAELALSYLRQWGGAPRGAADDDTPTPARPRGDASIARPGATAGDLRHAALDLLNDQARVKRELAALDKIEAHVADVQPVARGKQGWRTVRFDVWTPTAASLRVHYNVGNTWWRPTYRASVDVAHGTLRLDRQADLVQASGEDWSDVKVKLSTGHARREAEGATPESWWLDLVTVVARAMGVPAAAMPLMAPAPIMLSASPQAKRRSPGNASESGAAGAADARPVEPPTWVVDTVVTDEATEFSVGQPVTLASEGETHTLMIDSQSLPVTLKRRTTPRADPRVYLLAAAVRPAGTWPAGPLQSLRDGTLVGTSAWDPAQGETMEIALGQDDQMHVDVETPGSFTSTNGLFGGRVQRKSTAVYAIVNQHAKPVTVEMLDAAPVSRNEEIKVTHTYDPVPSTTDWDERTGVAAWTLDVPARNKRRVSVGHVVDYPKNATVGNLP